LYFALAKKRERKEGKKRKKRESLTVGESTRKEQKGKGKKGANLSKQEG